MVLTLCSFRGLIGLDLDLLGLFVVASLRLDALKELLDELFDVRFADVHDARDSLVDLTDVLFLQERGDCRSDFIHLIEASTELVKFLYGPLFDVVHLY